MLESIAPPYTSEFVQLFLPMVENEEITGTMRGDGENDLVSDFIGKFLFYIQFSTYIYFFFLPLVYCKANYVLVA